MNRSCTTLLLCSLASVADAAVFNVTRTDDPMPDGCAPADCSLREAVIAANAAPGRDTVQLLALTYDLNRIDITPDTHAPEVGPLWVTETLTVDGAGRTRTRIRWNTPVPFENPVFWTDTTSTTTVSLTVRDMTVSAGRGDRGGCISMVSNSAIFHKLILDASRLEDCVADLGGGAAYLHNTHLSLRNAQLVGNSTANSGGALELAGAIDVDSQDSIVSDNHAGQGGGAVRIYGNGLVGVQSDVVWVDDGTSIISDNHADGDGGAFSLIDTATLDLSTAAGAAVGQLLHIQSNTAFGAGGGLHFGAGLTSFPSTNHIHRVRVTGNTAASGGGVHSAVSLHISASELAANLARTGSGGGVAFVGSTEWPAGRSLDRVGIHHNTALGGGGGVFSECASFQAFNASIHLNQAASGRGQGIETIGPAQLRHVTLHANTSSPIMGSPGLYKDFSAACGNTLLQYANSLIDDHCASTVATQLVSDGGNQLGVDATGCPALPGSDEYQMSAGVFLLGPGSYGGDFEVVGWPSDSNTRPQRDFGLAAYCTATDARGFPRADGLCDAGAFEQQ